MDPMADMDERVCVCVSCVHGRKRKCICGGKKTRKRAKHTVVLNVWGLPMGAPPHFSRPEAA